MRVVKVILEYLPIAGGAQRQIAAVAPHLLRRGIEVHVVTRRSPGLAAEETVDGVHVHRIPAPGPKAVASLLFTLRALLRLRALRPDVVHAFSLFSPTTVGLLARRWLGVPLVVKVLRGGRAGEIERLRAKPGVRSRLAAIRRGVDRFLAISREIDTELAAIGIGAGRRVALPNGVDVARFRPPRDGERAALRGELGLPPGRVAIFCGRLVPEKRVDLLLEAWGGVAGSHPEATLVIAGSGPLEPALRRMAGPGVRFVGAVDDVAPWLRAADVFVLPSDTEGLSNALLEAMAAGLPVVATRVGGAEDVVRDGESGRLVAPGDGAALGAALVALLASGEERTALGRAARRTMAESFALESVAARLVALYEALVAGAAPRPLAAPVVGDGNEEAAR